MTGIRMSHAPYRGSLPALNDVVAGHIPLMFCDLGPAAGALAAGKVRPLGISSRFRVPAYPDIPPIAEAGVPGFEAVSLADDRRAREDPASDRGQAAWRAASILRPQDAKDQIVRYGFVPIDSPSVEGLQAFVKAEIERWGTVVREAGFAGSQ